jgi:hypothetical protein
MANARKVARCRLFIRDIYVMSRRVFVSVACSVVILRDRFSCEHHHRCETFLPHEEEKRLNMTKLTKVLIASALSLTFAVPALAAEEATLAERNVYLNQNNLTTQPAGAEAFAAAPAVTNSHRHAHRTHSSPAVETTNPALDPGISSQS